MRASSFAPSHVDVSHGGGVLHARPCVRRRLGPRSAPCQVNPRVGRTGPKTSQMSTWGSGFTHAYQLVLRSTAGKHECRACVGCLAKSIVFVLRALTLAACCRRALQEGGGAGRTELPAAHPGRGRHARDAGETGGRGRVGREGREGERGREGGDTGDPGWGREACPSCR